MMREKVRERREKEWDNSKQLKQVQSKFCKKKIIIITAFFLLILIPYL